jgi:FHA domain-containing protein
MTPCIAASQPRSYSLVDGQATDVGGRGTTPAPSGSDGANRGRPGYGMPRLIITRGRGVGRDESIATQCVIGREYGADIVVGDLRVSRRHACIALQGETYVILDLGSRNGTIVNGQKVRSAELSDGDVIHLGPVEFLFRHRQKDVPMRRIRTARRRGASTVHSDGGARRFP